MGRALGLLLSPQQPEDDERHGTDDFQLSLFADRQVEDRGDATESSGCSAPDESC